MPVQAPTETGDESSEGTETSDEEEASKEEGGAAGEGQETGGEETPAGNAVHIDLNVEEAEVHQPPAPGNLDEKILNSTGGAES